MGASWTIILGELSLDGSIKPARGVLSVAVLARGLGKKLIVPTANTREAAIVEGAEVYGAESLSEVVEFLNGGRAIEPVTAGRAEVAGRSTRQLSDLSDVLGQAHVKRALEVAAAGSHNMLMIGPPGSGKTMLAMRIPGILPDMTLDEAIETTKVHSVAGVLDSGAALVVERPFRSPHHTISDAGLIGGGKVPRPGEVSLAHNGVLFLDELPEFRRNVLEVMRQPLEDGKVSISRALVSLTYPSEFMLVAAMNPCPCGFLGDPQKECVCTPLQVRRYRGRISGPLLDRIDIHCEVPAVRYREMASVGRGETSAAVKERVDNARKAQATRFKGSAASNSRMSARLVKRHCELAPDAARLIETAVERLGLSARAYTRILKVARTIADLEGEEGILSHHVSEAIQYRTLDRQ